MHSHKPINVIWSYIGTVLLVYFAKLVSGVIELTSSEILRPPRVRLETHICLLTLVQFQV